MHSCTETLVYPELDVWRNMSPMSSRSPFWFEDWTGRVCFFFLHGPAGTLSRSCHHHPWRCQALLDMMQPNSPSPWHGRTAFWCPLPVRPSHSLSPWLHALRNLDGGTPRRRALTGIGKRPRLPVERCVPTGSPIPKTGPSGPETEVALPLPTRTVAVPKSILRKCNERDPNTGTAKKDDGPSKATQTTSAELLHLASHRLKPAPMRSGCTDQPIARVAKTTKFLQSTAFARLSSADIGDAIKTPHGLAALASPFLETPNAEFALCMDEGLVPSSQRSSENPRCLCR